MRVVWWLVAVLIFNAVWFGWYVSFPLFGEDGAANHSSLVETVRSAPLVSSRFPLKWLEGLGQPNVFVTLTFDPFAWLMRLPLASADVQRLSYVLRATLCWFTTYLWVRALFRRARGVPETAGLLAVLVNFTLTHPRGAPAHGAMFNATQAALFPALLWLYDRIVVRRSRIGGPEIAFAAGLVLFFLTYPLGSLLALPVLAAYGVGILATARPRSRPAAVWALGKLGALTALVLLAPGAGLYHTWASVVGNSARQVFAMELTSYGSEYLPPLFWSDVPLSLRTVVLMGAALVLLAHWPRPVRAVVVALGLVVSATQIATVARAAGFAGELLQQLPRPFYIEFYLPPFYAVAAGYTVNRLVRLAAPPPRARPSWTLRLVLFAQAAFGLGGSRLALSTAGLIAACGWLDRRSPLQEVQRRLRAPMRAAPSLAMALLFGGAALTLKLWPDSMHPLFAANLLCRDHDIWCREPEGLSIGAAANPLTNFLQARLATSGVFRGRAEFLLTPAPRLMSLPINPAASFSPEDLQHFRDWYARAHAQDQAWFPPWAFPSRMTPFRLTGDPTSWRAHELLDALASLAKNGDPVEGILPDDVLVELVEWAKWAPEATASVRFAPPWIERGEVTIMVEERNRNFLATGNGMLLRALPSQQVPVASSYEQALDYLYYLFWTRYVNEGATAQRSINFTVLETLNPERLGLTGVRYVVARDIPFRTALPLPRVFTWQGYSVYEIARANIAGYRPTQVAFGASLAQELLLMRTPGFDPRAAAVLPASAQSWLGTGTLTPLRSPRLTISGQSLVFEAAAPGHALAVLPFRFSHCWRAEWSGGVGRVVRADLSLLGVVFEGATRVNLSWTAGYGPAARCLREDAALADEAREAARVADGREPLRSRERSIMVSEAARTEPLATGSE